jgi:hypothetical protein
VTSLAATPVTAGILHIVERVAAAYGLTVELALPLSMYMLYFASLSLVSAQLLIISFAPSQALQFDSSAEHSAHWIGAMEALRRNGDKLEELFKTRLEGALTDSAPGIDTTDRERIAQRAAQAAAEALVKDKRTIENDIARELSRAWVDLQKAASPARWLAGVLFALSVLGYLTLIFWFGPRTLFGLG